MNALEADVKRCFALSEKEGTLLQNWDICWYMEGVGEQCQGVYSSE